MGDPALFKTVYQDVNLSGPAGVSFTISGHSKVENPTASKIYGYIINTYDTSGMLQEKFTFNFDSSNKVLQENWMICYLENKKQTNTHFNSLTE